MYGTEVMTSYSDVIVKILHKLFHSKYDIIYTVEKEIWCYLIFNKRLGLKICRTEGMTSYSDIVIIFRKLFHLKPQFEIKFDYNDFLAKNLE